MTTLVLADHNNAALSPQTLSAITAATQLGAPVHVLVCGHACAPVAELVADIAGVDHVILAENAALKHLASEPVAELLVGLSGDFDTLMAPATTNGKSIMPRVAALLDVMQISEISKVITPDTFERPIYAGSAIQTVKSNDAKRVITVRSVSFAPAAEGGSAAIETIQPQVKASGVRHVSKSVSASDRPDLSTAKIVVSGGRALGSKANFDQYIGGLAGKMGAAVGASRAAVDAGFASNDLQVGQTGKKVAPDIYIACGISGAIQHLAGMKEAKIIVAINSDAEAPIFQIADYGLVGDLFQLLPELESQLN